MKHYTTINKNTTMWKYRVGTELLGGGAQLALWDANPCPQLP